jgi:hypothetical protein
MPNIKTFEAGEVKLTPSEAGSAAFREAGAVASRSAVVASEQMRLAGTAIGKGIANLGEGLDSIYQSAQTHTDTTAELAATKDATANDLAALDAIQGVGTGRKDESGNADPSSPAFNAGTADVLENYQKTQEGEREKFAASGASQKAQDRFAQHQATRLRSVMIKAHSEGIMVAGQEALGNVDKAMNTSAALIDRHPEQLDSELERFDNTVRSASAVTGKLEAQQTLGPKAVDAKGALISASIFSYARSGQLDQVQRVMDDPKYDAFIGKHRETIENKVASISQARIRDTNAKDKAADDQVGGQQDALVDQIYRNSRLPQEQQNPNLSRAALETSPLFVGRPGDLEKARKTLDSLTRGTVDPAESERVANGVSLGITSGKVTTPAQIDAAYNSGKVTWQDRTRLQTELKDALDNPATVKFNTSVNEWMKRNEGSIDRSFGASIFAGERSTLGQQMVGQWQADVKVKAAAMRAKGEDPHSLLDPNSPNSMVTAQALAPYRVTMQMEQKYQAEQKAADQATNAARGVPQGKGATAPPITIPKDMPASEVIKKYPPGTKLILPDGTPGTVPGTLKMNFSPENSSGRLGAQQAIDDALQPRPDAHLDKNLFSSGRAQQLGISGGVGKNLTTIEAGGQSIQVNAQAAPHFKAFLDDLQSRGYKIQTIGGFDDRMKAGTFSSVSEHAYGNAIDINADRNPFRTSKTDMPANVSQIAAKYGLIWGGDWRNPVDPMHFEWGGKGGATTFASR